MTSAVLVAALAAALLLGPAPERGLGRLTTRPGLPGRQMGGRSALAYGLLAGAVLIGAAFGLRVLGWAVIIGVAAGTVARLVMAHRRRAAASRAAEEVARAATVLSSLLRSGQIPTRALAEAAEDCPVLAPSAAAAQLGADVGEELRTGASLPGQEGMALISAAWRVSERSGAPVADVLATVAGNLRRRRQLGAVIETELAAARSSGHIMAALPFLAVGLGFLAGADPLGLLFGHPAGQLLVFGGVLLTAGGVLWIDRLAQGSPAGRRRRGSRR